MRMNTMRWFAATALLVASCSGEHDHEKGHNDEDDGHGHGAGAVAITHFTETTELFVEFPPLTVGKESGFAAHLTRVADFRPVEEGTVTVTLSGGGAADERFVIDSPQVAGIFRPIAVPKHAGKRRLTLQLDAGGKSDTHDLGEQTVFADESAAQAAHVDEEESGAISFLKEQQWRMEFATAELGTRTIRPTLSANGTIRARSAGEVRVTAPVAGRLTSAGADFPRIGAKVERGEVLVRLAPRLGDGTDPASLELAVTRARLDLEQARKEKERLEGLLKQGAVPERRVIATRHVEATAQAELAAAKRRLSQHGRAYRAGAQKGGGIAVRAPITGTVVSVGVAPGVFVDEGQEILHVIDLSRLWLDVRVPEVNIGRVENAVGAWFEVEGFDQSFEVPADRVVASGGVVDPRSRTVSLVFDVDNPERRLRVGMFARVHVLTGAPASKLALPVSAVVEDRGLDIVFVQVGGESYEQRMVELGARDGGYAEVVRGLRAGERVVVKGAFAVKLAASGSSIPAHGHAH